MSSLRLKMVKVGRLPVHISEYRKMPAIISAAVFYYGAVCNSVSFSVLYKIKFEIFLAF